MVISPNMAESCTTNTTPKKYTCACGLAQEEKKSKFLGRCRNCHTRAKYLRGQRSFDPDLLSRGLGSSGNSPYSSTAPSANNSDDGGAGGRAEAAGGVSTTATTTTTSVSSSSRGRVMLRRRSRSVDRYDGYRISDPPPYTRVADGSGGRARRGGGAVRRAESEDSARTPRAPKIQTPPPPYELAQSETYYQFPPSYEEALSNTISRLTLTPTIGTTTQASQQSALSPRGPILPPSVTSAAALLPVGVLNSRSSRVLEEQAAVLEAQREAQRQARREAQLEQERDMERQRIRELQLAQYCGCAKCQSLYYSYYYDDPMNDGGAFPMETQVLMQEVLTDGLAFCNIM